MQIKQHQWEAWFVLSCILFLFIFMIGTMEGSKEFCPYWVQIALGSVMNLLVCIYFGNKPSE